MEEFAVNYAKQKIIEMCEEWMYAGVAELFQEPLEDSRYSALLEI